MPGQGGWRKLSAMIALVLLLLAAVAGPPPYPESLACAGYTHAASQLSDITGDHDASAKAFDAAIFWGLATMDAARRDGLTARAAEADQIRERDRVKPLLAAGDAAARAGLEACVERAPPLKG